MLKPESLMMSYGYKPELSEGALKCPIFQTSTFVFKTAEEGKAFFEIAYGQREKSEGEELGLIYSRLNNPDLEILENRLALWEQADDAAVFESGLAAITTCLLCFLKPGDLLLCSEPLYGGTHHFVTHFLPEWGVRVAFFGPHDQEADIRLIVEAAGANPSMIFIETPANPTNDLFDLELIALLAEEWSSADRKVITACDNTYMGPMWQHPQAHGIDLSLYSATKFIGGHSDVIAGAVTGSRDLMKQVKTLRTFLGNMASPWTGWLLMRSLETLKVRTDRQAENALKVAEFLRSHPLVNTVYDLDRFAAESREAGIRARQCPTGGSMISFEIDGGEPAAFRFLNALRLVHLAVSLGSTESLAEHPATMTHCDVPLAVRQRLGISPGLVRLSVGVEAAEDLIADLEQALGVAALG